MSAPSFSWAIVARWAVTTTLLLGGFCGNCLVFVGTRFYKSMSVDTITMWFIQCLATVDVCTACLLLYLFLEKEPPKNINLSNVMNAFFWSFLMVEAYMITIMVFHRFFCLIRPLRSLTLRKRYLWVLEVVLALTSFPLCFCIQFLAGDYKAILNIVYICVALLVPLIILFIALVGIWTILNKNVKKDPTVDDSHNSFASKILCSLCGGLMVRKSSDKRCVFKKGAVLLFCVGASFDLSLIPMQVVLLRDTLNGEFMANDWVYIRWLYLLGTSVNPFIYTAMSKKFRKFLVSALLCRKPVMSLRESSVLTSVQT